MAYVVAWVLISWLSIPALDSYGDMVENYAWSQTLAWGTFKHPPLVAWMVGAWFAVFPTETWPYYVLSYLMRGSGSWGLSVWHVCGCPTIFQPAGAMCSR